MRVGEQRLRDLGGRDRRVEDPLPVAANLLDLVLALGDQLGVSADRREDVVELVREAGRHRADHLELLRFEQLLGGQLELVALALEAPLEIFVLGQQRDSLRARLGPARTAALAHVQDRPEPDRNRDEGQQHRQREAPTRLTVVGRRHALDLHL